MIKFNYPKSLFLFAFIIYCFGLFIPIIEIDAAQYAEMSRELLFAKNKLHFFDIGTDYLDKPPLLFWLSSLSMSIFGVSTVAYKLPSFLFGLWAIYALYRFVLLYYSKEIAEKSALAFAFCQALFLIQNDIKTDTILMSCIISSFYFFSKWLKENILRDCLIAAIFIALGLLTKGPIALIVFVFGVLSHFILKKQYQNLFRWQYFGMFFVIIVLLFPMIYGLYTQFDLHPEKIVNGEKNVSGLRFFFWTQSFGRITGESVWNNNAPFYFLYENLLWGIFPFTLFFISSSFFGIYVLFNRVKNIEWMSLGAIILSYLALGSSRFQLPHYIYVVLPFICLYIVRFFLYFKYHFPKFFKIQYVTTLCVLGLLFLLLPFLISIAFPEIILWQILLLVLCLVLFTTLLYFSIGLNKVDAFHTLILSNGILNIAIGLVVYPILMQYQMSGKLPSLLMKYKINTQHIFTFPNSIERSCDFVLNKNLTVATEKQLVDVSNYIITNDEGIQEIKNKKIDYSLIYSGKNYKVSTLNIQFFNPAYRAKKGVPYYIIKPNLRSTVSP